MTPAPERYSNQILDSLPLEEQHLLNPLLERHELVSESVVARARSPLPHVLFPVDALVAIRSSWRPQSSVELALIGREGAAGASVALEMETAPHDLTVAKAGRAYAISTKALIPQLKTLPKLRVALMLCIQRSLSDIAAAAAVHAFGAVTERVAARLSDRFIHADGPVIHITHAELSRALGVPRPGVTVALQILEGRKAIRAKRGLIQLIDRDVLLNGGVTA